MAYVALGLSLVSTSPACRHWSGVPMKFVRCSLLLWPLAFLSACEQGGRPSAVIEVKASNDPLHEPRMVLERYAAGQPLASEVSSFPAMVANVRKTDPGRADILEKGLEEIQKGGGAARAAKSKELLEKLKPSMTGAPAEPMNDAEPESPKS